MGRGTAVRAARSLEAPHLVERLAAAAAIGHFTPPGWEGLLLRIELERLFAN